MKKKSKIAYEFHLNELYADTFSESQALDNFLYLTNKNRNGGNTTEQGLINAHKNHTLGTMLRRYDKTAFNTGYDEWNP